jgi:hypothetical protein
VAIAGLFVGSAPVVNAQSIDAKALVLPPTDVEPGWQAASATGDASAYEVQYINTTSFQYSRFAVVLKPNSELAQQSVAGLVPAYFDAYGSAIGRPEAASPSTD